MGDKIEISEIIHALENFSGKYERKYVAEARL